MLETGGFEKQDWGGGGGGGVGKITSNAPFGQIQLRSSGLWVIHWSWGGGGGERGTLLRDSSMYNSSALNVIVRCTHGEQCGNASDMCERCKM